MSIIFYLCYNRINFGGVLVNYDKIRIIHNQLLKHQVVVFSLYNALYEISFSSNFFVIHQIGIDVLYQYSSLDELFHQYVVYGDSLLNAIQDIKII